MCCGSIKHPCAYCGAGEHSQPRLGGVDAVADGALRLHGGGHLQRALGPAEGRAAQVRARPAPLHVPRLQEGCGVRPLAQA
eukprot:6176405-Pleurochrysis_carterae.AAC.1